MIRLETWSSNRVSGIVWIQCEQVKSRDWPWLVSVDKGPYHPTKFNMALKSHATNSLSRYPLQTWRKTSLPFRGEKLNWTARMVVHTTVHAQSVWTSPAKLNSMLFLSTNKNIFLLLLSTYSALTVFGQITELQLKIRSFYVRCLMPTYKYHNLDL